ncbi:unnamed protein product [Parajaminaea phylloscopi]
MEQQLIQAVDIASNPTAVQDPSLPQQALQFLEHLKATTHESWSVGWSVYAARNDDGTSARYSDQARLFGLNLVADYLETQASKTADIAESIAFLQDAALRYIQSEFVSGSGERGLVFIKNKFAQVLTMLLLQTYSLSTPTALLPSLLSLLRTHSPSSAAGQSDAAPLNLVSADLVLRVLHDLSITLGSDVTLRSVRSKERLQRDSVVRDNIRASHAGALAEGVWSIIEEGLQRAQGDSVSDPAVWDSARGSEVTAMAISVVGDYVSWIDISLMVNARTVPIFFSLLQHTHMIFKKAACEALLEVISKGMKADSKLELLHALNLTPAIATLEAELRTNGSEGQDELVDLREKLAKLANGITLEFVKILEEPTVEDRTRTAADEMLLHHLPLVLAFFADEYDEPTECVLSGINSVLSYFKKLKKKSAPNSSLPQPQLQVLSRLVEVVLLKMKYDDSAEWTGAGTSADKDSDGGFSDDDEAHFVELRKQLQNILGSVAVIDEELFASQAQALITDTLAAVEAGQNGRGAPITWQHAEVALFVTYFYVEIRISAPGQPKVGVNANTFVQLPTDAARLRNKLSHGVYPTLPLNQLGELIQKLVDSSISTFAHPAVQLQFFECLNRYAPFFVTRPDRLPAALSAFSDARGLYNPHTGVRYRVWYLFSRFVKEISCVLPHEYVQRVLESLREVLVVRAELPATAGDEDPLLKARETPSGFDSQVYLFESCGGLIGLLTKSSDSAQAVTLLKAVCDPLVAQLHQAVSTLSQDPSNLREVLQVHHLMLAMSNLAKGFPDMSSSTSAPSASDHAWMAVFKSMTEQVLVALAPLSQFLLVREAARGAFARIVATTGQAVLPLIPNLIQCLLEHLSSTELVDFLNFLGLIVAKYRDNVFGILDELFLLLLGRIFHFLNREVTGTDDAVERAELQSKYIYFISTLTTSGLDGVLLSERNRGQMESVLQSIIYYAENGEPGVQRTAFSVLSRLITLWGTSSQVADAQGATNTDKNADGSSSSKGPNSVNSPGLPGFETFIYETIVPLTFTVPAKPTFEFSDAQSQMVLTEIAQLLKTVLAKRGAQETGGWLLEVYFPRIQCPQEMATDFWNNLQHLDAKKWKAYFQSFIQSSRGG